MTINDTIIKTNELETWLYGAANILRGPINAADFKTYIFPLIFLRIDLSLQYLICLIIIIKLVIFNYKSVK